MRRRRIAGGASWGIRWDDMDSTLMLYLYVFPSVAVVGVLAWLIFIALMPASARTHLAAWLMKRGKVLIYLADDAGRFVPHLMRGDMGQGIFTDKGLDVFVNRPTEPTVTVVEVPVMETVQDAEGNMVTRQRMIVSDERLMGVTERREVLDMDPATKAEIDHIINHRVNLDTGIPVFCGYISKSCAVGPRLLQELERVHRIGVLPALPALKKKDAPEKKAVVVDLIDPRLLMYYIPKTWSPSLIGAVKWKAREAGYWDGLGKKQAGKGGTNWLIPLLLIGGAVLLVLVQTGVIPIPGLNS